MKNTAPLTRQEAAARRAHFAALQAEAEQRVQTAKAALTAKLAELAETRDLIRQDLAQLAADLES